MRYLLTLALLTVPAGLVAQEAGKPMPPHYREVQVRMLELQRDMLLAMADSMPESLYREAATPAQRDFAQQLHHAASTIVFIGARFAGATPPALPDTATVLNGREGMRGYINAVYDFGVQALKDQSDEARATVVSFFGGQQIPNWQVWDEIHQHTIWTAGQCVANFRKHGMAPPGFGFF